MWGQLASDVGQTFTDAYNWIVGKVSDIGKFFYDPETGSILGINFEQLLEEIMALIPSKEDLLKMIPSKDELLGGTAVGRLFGYGGNDEEDVAKPASTEKEKEQGFFGRLFSDDDKTSVVKYDGLGEDVKNMIKAIIPNFESLGDAKQEKYMKQLEQKLGMSLNKVDNSTINKYFQTGKLATRTD